MYKWLHKLRAFGIIDRADVYWELGKYYGYPICCIKNFVNMTTLADVYGQWEFDTTGTWMQENIAPPKSTKEGYVECVLCRTV